MPQLSSHEIDVISQCYLPSRYAYHYARGKLRRDPLFSWSTDVLRGRELPLLDVGCGPGLLAQAMRICGMTQEYFGIDLDKKKIDRAQHASAALTGVIFQQRDVSAGLPQHCGDVALLDVLHYLPQQAQQELLRSCAKCVAPDGQLILRVGIGDGSARHKRTARTDRLMLCLGLMRGGKPFYPTQQLVLETLTEMGLYGDLVPGYQGTPYNNWCGVFRMKSD